MRATVTFSKLTKELRTHVGDADYLNSKVFFDMQIDNKKYPNLTAAVKQNLGPGSASIPLEVSEPEGYEGPFNFGGFRNAVVNYYNGILAEQKPDSNENTISKVETYSFYIYTRG